MSDLLRVHLHLQNRDKASSMRSLDALSMLSGSLTLSMFYGNNENLKNTLLNLFFVFDSGDRNTLVQITHALSAASR